MKSLNLDILFKILENKLIITKSTPSHAYNIVISLRHHAMPLDLYEIQI